MAFEGGVVGATAAISQQVKVVSRLEVIEGYLEVKRPKRVEQRQSLGGIAIELVLRGSVLLLMSTSIQHNYLC
jgi:hypothetical protein